MKQGVAKEKCLRASQKHRGLIAVVLTVAGSLCIVVCLLLLLGYGTTSVVAFLHSLNFVETSCVVNNVTLLELRLKCNCREVCRSTFPCLIVQVEYNLRDIDLVQSRHNVTTILFHKDTILNNQCSYEPSSPCSESEKDNDLDVQRFQASLTHPGNTSLRCLYNPTQPKEVILTRTSTTGQILTMLLVPSVFLLMSIVLIVLVHRYFGAKHICHMIRMARHQPRLPTYASRKTSSRKTSSSSMRANRRSLIHETITE